jgi:hypothetical protein
MRPPSASAFIGSVLGTLIALVAELTAQPTAVPALLERIGYGVQVYFARAQSILCIESVTVQPLGSDFLADGPARHLVFELRVNWDAAGDPSAPPDATILRELISVNGRRPHVGDQPECTDPRTGSPEPLAFLLPSRRDRYMFSWVGMRRSRNRSTVLLDYRPANSDPPEIEWQGNCVSISLPAQTGGRVWADAETDAILRVDEHLTGRFSLQVPPEHRQTAGPLSFDIERADSSIRYQPVTFHDPDETLLVPESLVTMQIIWGASQPRLRTVHKFSGYKRFMTDAHVVQD